MTYQAVLVCPHCGQRGHPIPVEFAEKIVVSALSRDPLEWLFRCPACKLVFDASQALSFYRRFKQLPIKLEKISEVWKG